MMSAAAQVAATDELGRPPARWDPWSALRSRPHILFRLDPVAATLGGGLLARRGDRTAIVIDPALDRRRRRCALAHELVHDERGGGCDRVDAPPSWDAVVHREELRVDREVAARLVPAGELAHFLQARVEVGDPAALWEVAEEFDVDEATAARAVAAGSGP
ncbi:MAG: hypothetical protein JWN46_1247 [Acidimicrobiales bacterium]|nr:hypothetical protein [Acidimicrobiales bacterium]